MAPTMKPISPMRLAVVAASEIKSPMSRRLAAAYRGAGDRRAPGSPPRFDVAAGRSQPGYGSERANCLRSRGQAELHEGQARP
jgi:hypothetical protein